MLRRIRLVSGDGSFMVAIEMVKLSFEALLTRPISVMMMMMLQFVFSFCPTDLS